MFAVTMTLTMDCTVLQIFHMKLFFFVLGHLLVFAEEQQES